MSVQALNWARKMGAEADLPPAQLLLLWLLADQANAQWECWPGVARLARDSNQSEKSVRRHLGSLEQAGLIARYIRRGHVKNHQTGEVYANVRKSDLIVLQSTAASGAAADNEPVFHDASESFEGYIAGPVGGNEVVPLTGRGQAVRMTSSSKTPRRSEPDNLTGSLESVETQADNLTGRGQAVRMTDSSKTPRISEPDNLTGRGSTGQNEGGLPVKSPRVGAREIHARGLNPHKEPSISSSSSDEYRAAPAGRRDDDDETSQHEVGASHRGVNLSRFGEVVLNATGWDCSNDQLRWLADAILDRSARPVGRPARFVTTAVTNDPAAIRDELAAQFSRPGTAAGAPVAVPCPIPEHAKQNLLRVNCPACRKWREFPRTISREVFDALDVTIREHVSSRDDVVIVAETARRSG